MRNNKRSITNFSNIGSSHSERSKIIEKEFLFGILEISDHLEKMRQSCTRRGKS